MDYRRRERVLKAMHHEQPDRTPTDFQAVSEIWGRLEKHFQTNSMKDILDILQIDCAWVDPQVLRSPDQKDNEGYLIGWGGSRLRYVYNRFGAHEEIVKYATSGCITSADIDAALTLPDLNQCDFSSVTRACADYDDRFLIGGFASCFYYPTLVRNMEDLLVDLILDPDLAHHLIKRCFDWHIDYHERLLKTAGGRLDAMQIADDFATQLGLLISAETFREFFRKPIMEYVSLAKSYGATPFLHCCGSAYHLIEEFISLGIEILDPVQTTAVNMEPVRLKEEFGSRLCFHGAGETQVILPTGSPQQVSDHAKMLANTLGKQGGYIMSSSHFLQADVPLENILAFYQLENR